MAWEKTQRESKTKSGMNDEKIDWENEATFWFDQGQKGQF